MPSAKKVGKNHIEELTRLLDDWTSESATKDNAFEVIMIMPSLLL